MTKTQEPSICVGCKWARWSDYVGGSIGDCAWPQPPVARSVMTVYGGERWRIYRSPEQGFKSCPVREPAQETQPAAGGEFH